MATQWLRRAWLLAAGALVLVLAGCGGGGTIESRLAPSRVIVFGDATADTSTLNARYTVNNGSTSSIWTEYVATAFGQTVTSFARGNARVTQHPDAAGNAATRTVQEQIDDFLAGGGSFTSSDLVLVSAGTSDVIANVAANPATAAANSGQAGRDLAAQVGRLVAAGATHVGVAGPYNLGISAWAQEAATPAATKTALGASSSIGAQGSFNHQLVIALQNAGLGSSVLYLSQEAFINAVIVSPSTYGITNLSTPVCTSVDPGPGIGTGNGQVNSSLCNGSTLVAAADPLTYTFADRIYLTPTLNAQFGAYAYSKLRERW